MSTRFRGIKKVTALMLIMMMVIGSMPGWFTAGEGRVFAAGGLDFAGGSGTIEDPYLISNAQMLYEVRYDLNASYKLIADIDLSGYAVDEGWLPIGDAYGPFRGEFNGDEYAISNLTINRPDGSYVGLFGGTASKNISNVRLQNVHIISGSAVGGLSGYNTGAIRNSYVTGSVTGNNSVGGLVAFNGGGEIDSSYAVGTVRGNNNVGGLVGSKGGGEIKNSYARVNVTGNSNVGGLVGGNEGEGIDNSYAAGTVNSSDNQVGGLVGSVSSVFGGIPTNSFYDMDTTGQVDTGKGTGLSTADMKLQSSYTDWDFENIWTIHPSQNNGYPYLQAFAQFHVIYDGNGSTEGSVPKEEIAFERGAVINVAGNTGDMVKDGYTFMGWNTLAEGTGDNYSAGDTITASTTLFARWIGTNATLTSTVGTVSKGGTLQETITVPNGTTLSALKAAITPATGATYEAYEADGTTVATTLANGYKIIVTAEDGVTQVTYTVTVLAPSTPPGGGGNGGNTPPSSGGGGGAQAPSSGGGNSGSTPAQAPGKVTSTNGNLTLPVGTLGEVSLDDELMITVPAGAVNQELKITMTTLSDTTNVVVNQEVFASRVYEVLKNIPGNFTKPVTLTFAFDASLVKSGQRAGIFYFDEVNKAWVEVQGSKTSGNSIAVEVDHFTKFAVLVVGSATELPGTTPADSEVSVSDIAGHWAEVQIQQAIQAGIVNGYTDGTFKPGHTITRSEFTVMLMNALNAQEAGAELAFTDQAKIGTWARTAVAQAVQAGIISGYTDGTFQPNANITRAEMATMIGKAFELSLDGSGVTSFADDEAIPAWAKHAVATLQARGVVQGTGANIFNPRTQTTRAEAVVMLLNMLNVAE
ncbi:S-layer homology domain-containing protein [Paenibacillus sp. FSL H8-0317]|uniref:S-layer homology domain-containing protein n=1 Tax=Paenibacillus sp. FSL H8-0317 TaxID=2921385 RepID=UPI00324D0820